MHTEAAAEESITINWNQQSAPHWHSYAYGRRHSCLQHAWLLTAQVWLRNDGCNCLAKYTSWSCLARSSSSAAMQCVRNLVVWAAVMIPPRHPRKHSQDASRASL